MFEVPEAKRVRREDLDGSDGSERSDGGEEGADEELQAALNAQIAKSLGLDGAAAAPRTHATEPSRLKEPAGREGPAETDDDGAEGAEDEAYEFRLFSTSTSAPKIVLEDDQALKGVGGFVVPRRPQAHYLVADLPESEKRQYEFAAVTGDEVVALARRRAPGLELPWKVVKIAAPKNTKDRTSGDGPGAEDEEAPRRKRPGKKRRIALRTKERARKAQVQAAAKQQTDKEEHMKDKKKRLNRLKKLRKRAKDKEKKLAANGGDGGDGEDGSISGGDSDGSD